MSCTSGLIVVLSTSPRRAFSHPLTICVSWELGRYFGSMEWLGVERPQLPILLQSSVKTKECWQQASFAPEIMLIAAISNWFSLLLHINWDSFVQSSKLAFQKLSGLTLMLFTPVSLISWKRLLLDHCLQ